MRSTWTICVSAVAASGLLAVAAAATASDRDGHGQPQHYRAALGAVPHDPSADGGSNATGRARLALRGQTLSVLLKARGVSPDLPHAMHIHGNDHPEVSRCPGPERRAGGVSDALIETVDGIDDYGPILASFTTSADTSPGSGLALDRMPVGEPNGKLTYRRTIELPAEVAEHLDEKHIVIHGHDLDGDGGYDPGPITALGAPLEAELPVACGEIDRLR
ncbi:MAG TPA: hypothetical protein VNT54_01145 [Solirubrobacteraceae bacterium]|nr:hypothetical protein [Solirubrobacteraceae bacterium]